MGLIVVALAIVGYAVVSKRLSTTPFSGPLLFMVVGVLIGPSALALIHGAFDTQVIEWLLEGALALVLFTDALGISSGDWRAKGRVPLRLLVIGMPLTIVLGWLAARALLPPMDIWEAALIGICLAPTDAALGQAVVTSRKVPELIRQSLNIESGLNDGLALPFFVLALAAAAEAEHVGTEGVAEVFLRSLVLAALIGAVVGWAGALMLSLARERGWVGREWSQIGTLGLVILAFTATDHVGGSGFIATWVAGVAFGRATHGRLADAAMLSEDLGGLLATVSFLGFGAVLLGPILGHVTWQIVVYAILSLTVIRLVPVAISLIGSGFARPTYLFVGWFGPRGLASIVFGLFVAEEALPNGSIILDTVFVTVALSVILHGVSAVWGAARYGRWYEGASSSDPQRPEARDIGELRVRRRITAHAGHRT
jgi:NhaP-type Na+/H+ or K+/H+ antiporter